MCVREISLANSRKSMKNFRLLEGTMEEPYTGSLLHSPLSGGHPPRRCCASVQYLCLLIHLSRTSRRGGLHPCWRALAKMLDIWRRVGLRLWRFFPSFLGNFKLCEWSQWWDPAHA